MVAFDRVAVSEAGWLASHHRALRVERVRWLNRLPVPVASHVLDVGCGEGTFSAEIASDNRISSLCLTDVNEALLALAVEKLQYDHDNIDQANCCVADAGALPYPDNQFDVTFCLNVLEYVSDTRRVLSELSRVTRGGGLVVVKDEDAFRDLMLPWPPHLELDINLAWQAILKANTTSWRPDAGRQLWQTVLGAGFRNCVPHLVVHDICAPLSVDQEGYVRAAYANYLDQYRLHLAESTFDQLCHLLAIGRHSEEPPHWLRDPGFRFQSMEYAVVFSPTP